MRPEAGAVKDAPVEPDPQRQLYCTCNPEPAPEPNPESNPDPDPNPNPNPNSNPKANPPIKRLTLALALAPAITGSISTPHQIDPDPQRHLYFKSAFLMSHPMGSWRTAQRQMGRLTPVAEVAAGLVADDTMVGLHVRTVFDAPRDDATARTALGDEAVRAAESEYGTEGARRLMQWRKASHWSNFVPRIAALLQVQP